MPNPLHGFLADTWWYAMTARLPDEDLRKLVDLRASQRFTAAQVVVGIPPETTPENPNAASPFGPAWTRDGEFNTRYLAFARERIKILNRAGLRTIVYGAWGPQVAWLGVEKMTDWWKRVIEICDDLDVIYCLTGESNLQISPGEVALFRRSTGLLQTVEVLKKRSRLIRRVVNRLMRTSSPLRARRVAWSQVLESIGPLTDKPFLIHPNPNDSGFECVDNPHLLAANSAQTGHSVASRLRLHRLPLAHVMTDITGRGFINLEPWYEGIRGKFYGEDQLYAYWASMLAGAVSYCYGAHGIWNVGDGIFLGHWGTQSFLKAMALDTPRLLGLSHQRFQPFIGQPAEATFKETENTLLSIQRKFAQGSITFIPDVGLVSDPPTGEIWLPMDGRYTDHLPEQGQVVIFTSK